MPAEESMNNISIDLANHPYLICKTPLVKIIPHKTTVFFGKSGIGKTTVFNEVAAMLWMHQQKYSIVQHDKNLLPWLNVSDNIALKDHLSGTPKDATEIQEILAVTDLSSVQYQFPHQLSKGMQQRVCLGRVLYDKFDYVLLDEPFQNIDELTLVNINARFKTFFDGRTVVLITHDPMERDYFKDISWNFKGSPLSIEII
jgi:ABC-type nitrate/sulfonate/bicarbonate transport system ATPase subunit